MAKLTYHPSSIHWIIAFNRDSKININTTSRNIRSQLTRSKHTTRHNLLALNQHIERICLLRVGHQKLINICLVSDSSTPWIQWRSNFKRTVIPGCLLNDIKVGYTSVNILSSPNNAITIWNTIKIMDYGIARIFSRILFGVFHDRSSGFFSCGFKFVWQQSDNRF